MQLRSIALGAALVLTAATSQASLVTNGGFESGLTGWSCTAPSGFCSTGALTTPPEGLAHFSGFQNFAPAGVLAQSLATVAGETYSVSFLFNTVTDEPSNTLSVEVGNLASAVDLVVGTWTAFTGSFTASGTSTDLRFLFRTLSGTGTVQLDRVIVDRAGTVPTPASWGLVLLGLGLAAAARRARG